MIDRTGECLKVLESHALRVEEWRQERGRFPLDELAVPKCPQSGVSYRYLVDNALQPPQAWLFCCGQAHGVINGPAYDFAQRRSRKEGVEPPAQSWHHLQWLLESQDLDFLNRATGEASHLGEAKERVLLQAEALNANQRFDEALNLLRRRLPEPDKESAPLWFHALLAEGLWEQAMNLEQRFELGFRDQVLFCRGDFEALRPGDEAPRALDFFLPLAQNRSQEAFKAATLWLERQGYGHALSPFAILTQRVCCGSDLNRRQESRQSLIRGLSRCQRNWPFPLLQLANRELSLDEVYQQCRENRGRLSEYYTWAGLLQESQGRLTEARLNFEWMVAPGLGIRSYYEYPVACLRLGKKP